MDGEITQPLINIGLLGHVANGKSSLVRSITGEKTARNDSRCMQKGESREMTIQIGYSNAKIYQCDHCPKPDCYASIEGSKKEIPACASCGTADAMKLVQFVSFVDCFHPDTLVLMLDGSSKKIDQIQTSDMIMGDDGTARKVLNIQTGEKELYRIKYKTQTKNKIEAHEFTCTSGHILVLRIDTPVRAPNKRTNSGCYYVEYYCSDDNNGVCLASQTFDSRGEAQEFYDTLDKSPIIYESTVINYLQLPKRLRDRSRMFRASTLSFDQSINLEFGTNSEEIAWLIGLWLADGSKTCSRITVGSSETDILNKIHSIAAKAIWNVNVYTYPDRKAYEVYIGNNNFQKNSFTSLLRSLDLLNNKHIPAVLKFASLQLRYALLSGMIDGDGYYGKGEFEIVQSQDHLELAKDILWLCRSLGFSSGIAYKYATLNGQLFKQYRIKFNGDLSHMTIALTKKQGCSLQRTWATSQPFEVEEVGIGKYVGIETSGNNRFLLSDFIVVHNCPGHRMLMRNMISGSAVMDGAILVVDANNKNVPQVQTLEHLTAAEIVGINHYVLVAQNKIDLLLNDPSCKKRLLKNQQQIEEFVKDTGADLSRTPLIPTCVSPARQINLPLILQYLVERVKPNPHPAYGKYPMFIHCVRSFDINKPCPAIGLKGGVLGGTIMHGVLRIGDTLEIRPGYKTEAGEYCPLYTKVTSLYTGTVPLQEARPGGLIGIGTTLDPALTRSDAMVGMCAGYPEQLPPAMTRLELKLYMLTHGIGHDQEVRSKVGRLHSGDVVQLAIGSATVPAKMLKRIGKIYQFETTIPVCPVPGQSIPISKIVDGAWTIIGKAQLAGYTDTKTPPPVTTEFEPYRDLLERTLRDAEPVDLGGKLVVPPPQLAKDGGARLVWTNYRETCAALKREEIHLSAFFTEELATSVTINSIQQMVIHGKNRYQSSHIQSILVKYITSFVNCPTCRSAHTTLTREPGSKYTRMLCRRCGAEHLR